jgi:glycosyltransferase involved in cell wall biosynthesis
MMNTLMNKIKVHLLVDWEQRDDNWSFLQEFKKHIPDVKIIYAKNPQNYKTELQKVFRLWTRYVHLGFRAFLESKHCDVCIAYQGVAGLCLGLFLRVLGRKVPLILNAFIYKQRKNKLHAAFRYWFTRFTLATADRVICYSQRETEWYKDYFNYKDGKFIFLPFGVDTPKLDKVPKQKTGNYILSAGSSNRDYRTLIQATQNMPIEVHIIAKKLNLNTLKIPGNFKVQYDIYGEEFYKSIDRSKIIIVPLNDEKISSGQMVLLESMYMGKAVIVTRNWGTEDYVNDGHDAIFVSPHNADELKQAISRLLNDPERIDDIGKNARISVIEKYNVKNFAEQVAHLAMELHAIQETNS